MTDQCLASNLGNSIIHVSFSHDRTELTVKKCTLSNFSSCCALTLLAMLQIPENSMQSVSSFFPWQPEAWAHRGCHWQGRVKEAGEGCYPAAAMSLQLPMLLPQLQPQHRCSPALLHAVLACQSYISSPTLKGGRRSLFHLRVSSGLLSCVSCSHHLSVGWAMAWQLGEAQVHY